jgi:hypothetical protein
MRLYLVRLMTVGCLVSILLGVGSLRAQEVTASIYGTVHDPSGAVIAGADVKALQVSTNIIRSTTTDSAGVYQIPLLPPGSYALMVSYSGFKAYHQTGITLQINQHAEINIDLQLGTATQSVQVNAAAPLLTADNASVGKVDDSTTIQMMPLNGRLTITGLMALAPGLQNAGAQDQIPAYGVTPSIGGTGTLQGVGFSLDGVRNDLALLERGTGEYPPLDGIQEFKVITSDASAEYTNLGQVIVVSKGGSNQVHATLLEFNRNRFTAAKNFFQESLPLPEYNRNEFGGNFSGPVYFPHLYNGKDRTFFFFNYEGFRLNQAATANTQVPSAQERQGVFTGLATIINPSTGVAYPNNVITTAENPVSARLQQLYPVPNLAGTGPDGTGTNLTQTWGIPQHVNRYSFRIDETVSSKTQVSGTMMAGLLGPNPSAGSVSTFGGMAGVGEHNLNQQIGVTHTFTSSIVSESRLGYFHERIFRLPQNYNLDTCSFIPGLPCSQPVDGAPQVNITNIVAMGEAGSNDLDQSIQYVQNVSIVRGSHMMKTGLTYLHNRHYNIARQTPPGGTYSFNGQYTGVAYADFYLGYPYMTQLANPAVVITVQRQNRYSFYFEDQWRATPNLTVNLGIRNEIDFLQPMIWGAAEFVPSRGTVVVFDSVKPKAIIPSLLTTYNIPFASAIGLPTNIVTYAGGSDLNDWAPRVALAYKLGTKTVVRSGFGNYYQIWPSGDFSAFYSSQLPFGVTNTYENSTPGSTPAFSMSNPFPSGLASAPGNPTSVMLSKPKAPYTLSWNFTIERELFLDTALRVAYVGNRTDRGWGTPDFNAPMPAPGPTQAQRPYQPFSTISLEYANIYQNTDNELQIGLQRHYAKGLMLSAEYAYSSVLGNETYESPHNFADSYGNISNYRRHVLELAYSYDLPFGAGKYWLSSAHGVVGKLVGGWSFSGITALMSGQPFSVSFSSSTLGWPSSRANLVTGTPLYPSTRTIHDWFNASAFAVPAAFAFGNSEYDMLWGPGYQDWDMSLSKKTPLRGERASLQIRLDAYNAFNHPNFGNPNASISNPSTVGTITSMAGLYEPRTVSLGAKLVF